MQNEIMTDLPAGAGVAVGVGEGASAIQSVVFQAASAARACGLDFTVKL